MPDLFTRIHQFINSEAGRYPLMVITGLAFGLVIGFAAGGVFVGASPGAEAAPFGAIEFFVARYQTLIAGVLALVGAWLLWIQIQDQRKQAKIAREQAEIAARIRIPHALSRLGKYWKHCYDAWLAEDPDKVTQEPPYNAIETIMAAAPSADPATFATIKKLTILSQAFEARIMPFKDVSKRNRLDNMIVDIARLNHLADLLYGYGRLEADTAPLITPTRSELEKKLQQYRSRQATVKNARIISRIERAFDLQFGRRPPVVDEDEDILWVDEDDDEENGEQR